MVLYIQKCSISDLTVVCSGNLILNLDRACDGFLIVYEIERSDNIKCSQSTRDFKEDVAIPMCFLCALCLCELWHFYVLPFSMKIVNFLESEYKWL